MKALQACVRFKVVTLRWLNVVSKSLTSIRDCEVFSYVWEMPAVGLARADFLPCSWPCHPSYPRCPCTGRDCRHWVWVGARLHMSPPHGNSRVTLFCILKMFYILTVVPLWMCNWFCFTTTIFMSDVLSLRDKCDLLHVTRLCLTLVTCGWLLSDTVSPCNLCLRRMSSYLISFRSQHCLLRCAEWTQCLLDVLFWLIWVFL